MTDDVELAETNHETAKQRPEIRWGVGVSVLLHVPLIALLIFGLPKIEPKPAEDESVKVELVPPPEEKRPEEKPKEKPPEPKPPEQAKKQPPPPPPPPPPRTEAAKPQPQTPRRLSATAPVFEFGDKNTGSAKSDTGNSSQGKANPTPVPPPSVSPEAQAEPAVRAEDKSPPIEQPPTNPVPKDVNLPETAAVESHAERNGPSAASTEVARTSFEPERPSEAKRSVQQQDETRKEQLPQVKTLFSQSVSDDPVARTALRNMPRGQRMNDLCRTELKQQIEHISPKYRDPEIPNYRPFTNETIIQVMETGRFRTDGNWYSIQFECAVDTDATKILSFAFRFGGFIPRSQYAKYKIRE